METSGCRDAENFIFKGIKDRYNGLTINSSTESCDLLEFSQRLEASLKHWTTNNIRAIWFSISLDHAEWVPILAKNGFKFHHTKGHDVVMYKWLPKSEDCNIPPYAHTMVGVGAIILNSSGELLVVRERYPRISQWKLPGGYVEPGENIADAAVREVFEETNIRTEFKSLVCFRHMHNANYGCSDIYFIANLKPLTEDIKKCSREIDACLWMKVEEFLEHSQVHDGNRYFVRKCMEYTNNGSSIGCMQGLHPSMKKPQCVFSIMAESDIPPYKYQDQL